MTYRACPTCSGATDTPDGKGGIMPCPECSAVKPACDGYWRPSGTRAAKRTLVFNDPRTGVKVYAEHL